MILYSDDKTQSIDFDIPEQYKKICVNCSGGADSGILLYIVIDYLIKNKRTDTTVSVTTCSNDFKHRWNGRKAADVINWIIDKTGFENFDMHYTYYRDRQDSKYFNEVERQLFIDGRVDIMVSGITSNPLSECIVEDAKGNTVDLLATGLVDRNVDEDAPAITKGQVATFYKPFHKIDKKFVASMYRQYNAMPLFDLTRSCEAVPDSLYNSYDPNFEQEPCGTCWWCLERKWAFGRY